MDQQSSVNQTWTITAVGSYDKLIIRANGKGVDTGGGAAAGNVMQFCFDNASNNERWTTEL